MLVGLAGLLAGYDGSFEFKSGEKYPEGLNYTFMRVFLATFGALMVPLTYFTAYEMKMSSWAINLATTMVLFDTAYLCISRFILLDSMLLFFTLSTTYCLARFHNFQNRSFTPEWWFWIVMTGLNIGCVTSVKWVGAFVTALVGIYTIQDLWDKFGDLRMPIQTYTKHWLARIGALIVLPVLVYMTMFAIHFAILNHSGPGDAQMSSLFQAGLVGNDFERNPLELAYGSKATFKNMGYGGGLLHSHVQTYPIGSEQQQVTCYHYRDSNNDFIIKKPREAGTDIDYSTGEIEFVKPGDEVRLVHAMTGRNLHSHNVAAPVSKTENEVSCYGNETIGDVNDYWVMESAGDLHMGKKLENFRSLTSRIRFRHKTLNCYLKAKNVVLPQWGFKQVEVTCDKKNNPKDSHTHWNIEQHFNDRLPSGEKTQYRSSFIHDFWHLNVAMMTSNNALIPDPDKEDILASKPIQWPIMEVGLRMCSWADDVIKFYLLGNVAVWLPSTASLFVFAAIAGLYILRRQRKFRDWDHPLQWDYFAYAGGLCVLGWGLHYLPFFIMGRVTYLHHYFPALYYSILMVAFVLDHITDRLFTPSRIPTQDPGSVAFGGTAMDVNKPIPRMPTVKRHERPEIKAGIFIAGYVIVFAMFWYFKDIALGMDYPISEMRDRKWFKSWNLVD